MSSLEQLERLQKEARAVDSYSQLPYESTLIILFQQIFGENHQFTKKAQDIKDGWAVEGAIAALNNCIPKSEFQKNKHVAYCNLLDEAINYLTKYDDGKSKSSGDDKTMSHKVFIVHGHDDAAKQEMARTLEKAGFEAIILHEQASVGKTIIEKIESYTDVAYAVVLYTECDLGRDKNASPADEQYRARQNVVLEHGYLMGKLGRDHVAALVKGNIEMPGDISGIVYTSMDMAGAWKIELAKNMQAVGINVDFNKFFK